jgi:outer membrane protein TolC
LQSAEQAYDLAVQRYRAGLGNYLTVLTAENTVLTQRRVDADLRTRTLDSQVLLAQSLGGGYTAGKNATVAAAQ